MKLNDFFDLAPVVEKIEEPAAKRKETPIKTVSNGNFRRLYEHEIQSLNEGVDTTLRRKSKACGIPTSFLRQVYKRGVDAWKSMKKKPASTPHAFAMARVNSFINDGRARKADSHIWNKYQAWRRTL